MLSRESPNHALIQDNANIRKTTMSLTSNSRVEETAMRDLNKLVQECREGSCRLVEVMSVVWDRI